MQQKGAEPTSEMDPPGLERPGTLRRDFRRVFVGPGKTVRTRAGASAERSLST